MHRVAMIAASLLLLAGCSNKPAPEITSSPNSQPAASQAPSTAQTASSAQVEQQLRKVAGSDASDCGQVRSMDHDLVMKASDCAMEAAKSKKPFVVSYAMPGLTIGVAGTKEGKLFQVQSAVDNGQPSEPALEPCPAELRVAQSGRVTCIKAGAVGTMPGKGNPHGDMPPAGTPNPHQGMAPKSSH